MKTTDRSGCSGKNVNLQIYGEVIIGIAVNIITNTHICWFILHFILFYFFKLCIHISNIKRFSYEKLQILSQFEKSTVWSHIGKCSLKILSLVSFNKYSKFSLKFWLSVWLSVLLLNAQLQAIFRLINNCWCIQIHLYLLPQLFFVNNWQDVLTYTHSIVGLPTKKTKKVKFPYSDDFQFVIKFIHRFAYYNLDNFLYSSFVFTLTCFSVQIIRTYIFLLYVWLSTEMCIFVLCIVFVLCNFVLWFCAYVQSYHWRGFIIKEVLVNRVC